MIRRRTRFGIVLGVLCASHAAGAQNRITVAVGDGAPLRVPRGAAVAIPLNIDMSAAGTANLASISAALTWTPGVLSFDSVKAGAFGSITANTTAALGGVVALSSYSTTGATASTPLATFYFTASSGTGGTRLRPVAYAAGDELGSSVLGLMRPRALDICVADSGRWGDANGDGSVNIIDAQQIARRSVGLSIVSLSALNGRGDVNEDGAVDIIDAQQIARYAVEFPSVPRVNTTTLVLPDISTVTTPSATASVQVGRGMQLSATAMDADGKDLMGCAAITWSSSDTTKARVDQDGIVTGVAAGVPIISATAGGVTTRIAVNVGLGATPAAMSIVQGDGQYKRTAYGVKPQVRVVDSLNRAVPGVSVLFTNVGGTVTPNVGATQSSVTVVTDSSGIAEIAGWGGGGTAVPGQTTGDGTILQTVERLTATIPGLPAVTITGTALEGEVSASICLLTQAGTAYCHGEYVERSVEVYTDTLQGSVPVLVEDGVPMASLSPGFYGEFTCGVAKTGDGYCWGWNHAGQLGDGTQNRSRGMRLVSGGLSFLKIATGHTHACGITTTGKAYCWGLNQFGELGNGSKGGISSTPSPVIGDRLYLDIATTANATCGVTTGGETWCWGAAPFVDSTGARVSTPRRVPGAPAFTKVALGTSTACGMAANGDISCWGFAGPGLGDGTGLNRYSSFSSVRMPARGRDIWGSLDSYCASAMDGGLYCWGANSNKDITGVGDALPHAVPALVGYVNAARAQKQAGGFCYQTQNNQPYCFGRWAIGDGSNPFPSSATPPRYAPVPVKWVEGAAGAATGITVVSGIRQSATTGAAVPIAPSVRVHDYAGNPVSGASVTFSVTAGGGSITGNVATTDASGIATVGSWTLGTLGANELTATSGEVSIALRAAATPAPSFMQVISGDGQYQTGSSGAAWNGAGQFAGPVRVEVYDSSERPLPNVSVTFNIGTGGGSFRGQASVTVPTDSNGIASAFWSAAIPIGVQTATASVAGLAPVTITGTSTTGVASLSRCSLSTRGSAYCWGDNTHGQVGDGTVVRRTTPTPVSGGITFTQLAEGAADHACGLDGSGQMYCWGANNFGQIGDGSRVDATTPVRAAGSETFIDVAVSAYNTCGIRSDQSLMCWGWTGYDLFNDGQLGIIRPPTVLGYYEVPPKKIALGPNNACLLDFVGKVHCWGVGTSGQLGDGTFVSRSAPTYSGISGSYSSVTVGSTQVCALATSGTAYCWGAGALGNGSTGRTATPTAVAGAMSFTSLSASSSGFTCGTASDGVSYCWGTTSGATDNRFWGQLGDGTTTARSLPTPVLTGAQFTRVSAHYGTACGFVTSGQPYCWGSNYLGQVGDGTTTARTAPVSAKWPEGKTGIPVSLAINSGNNQSAVVGTSVGPLSVIVKDYAGTPLVGTTVTFTITSGDGELATTTATTNALGIATLTGWTLGSLTGSNTLTATAPGLPTVVFTATATASGGGDL